jgi:hypothetical protein
MFPYYNWDGYIKTEYYYETMTERYLVARLRPAEGMTVEDLDNKIQSIQWTVPKGLIEPVNNETYYTQTATD